MALVQLPLIELVLALLPLIKLVLALLSLVKLVLALLPLIELVLALLPLIELVLALLPLINLVLALIPLIELVLAHKSGPGSVNESGPSHRTTCNPSSTLQKNRQLPAIVHFQGLEIQKGTRKVQPLIIPKR